MRVDTTQYQFSHGSLPRGRGTWAFSFYGPTGLATYWSRCSATYTEAKKAAVQHVRGLGVNRATVIEVLP